MENRHWIGGKYSGQLSAASEAATTVWDNAMVPAFPVEFEGVRLGRKNVLPTFSAQFHPRLYLDLLGRKTWSKKRATSREPLDGLILQL